MARMRSRQRRVWSLMTSSWLHGGGLVGERPPQEVRVQLHRGQRRLELVRHGARDLADLGEALSLGGPAFLGEGVGEVGEEECRGAALAEDAHRVAERALAGGRGTSTWRRVAARPLRRASRRIADQGRERRRAPWPATRGRARRRRRPRRRGRARPRGCTRPRGRRRPQPWPRSARAAARCRQARRWRALSPGCLSRGARPRSGVAGPRQTVSTDGGEGFRAYPARDVRAGRSWTERSGHETVPS